MITLESSNVNFIFSLIVLYKVPSNNNFQLFNNRYNVLFYRYIHVVGFNFLNKLFKMVKLRHYFHIYNVLIFLKK
jgi:hypothetical protein